MDWKRDFGRGFKHGIPIGLGYLPVSFTFGFLAVTGGLPVWLAVFISLTNLTSAGQFAGTNLILAGAGYMEVALTTFVINLRYMLMSLSLSQKLERGISTGKRLGFAFGITDETFVVASLQPGVLTAAYMFGLIVPPIAGWNLGTLLGGCISTVLPEALQNAMGIALFAMFIALIIPLPGSRENIVRHRHRGGGQLRDDLSAGVRRDFVGIQNHHRHHTGLGGRRVAVPEGGDGRWR